MNPLLLLPLLGAAAPEIEQVAEAAGSIGFWEGALMGLVQGVTEFIPVSSSGHLAVGHLIKDIMDTAPESTRTAAVLAARQASDRAFDVSVHVATLFAMMLYFRDEIVEIFTKRPRMILLIGLACIPAVLVGLAAGDWFENLATSAYVVGAAFMVNGLFLIASNFFGVETRRMEDMSLGEGAPTSLVVGLAQAVALAPGISRSGITITSGFICGLRRSEAFAFSFLVGMPVIAGAAAYKMKDIGQLAVSDSWKGLAGGFAAAFFSGLIAVWILARLVKKRNLLPFGVYTLLLGIAVIIAKTIWG